jgi:hypothetical protein
MLSFESDRPSPCELRCSFVGLITCFLVDRILLSLLELGFKNLVRVGNIKKIAKFILPYTAQLRSDNNEGTLRSFRRLTS